MRVHQAAADQLRRERAAASGVRAQRGSAAAASARSTGLDAGARRTGDATDPVARVETANGAARVEPRREGYFNAVQVLPYSPGALYQVYVAPGQVTDIALAVNNPRQSATSPGWTIAAAARASSAQLLSTFTQPARPRTHNA